ncbi:hypothetical protein [Bartonella senegalensis]|nr:hypothetical protein [Bartonella senegalensis]
MSLMNCFNAKIVVALEVVIENDGASLLKPFSNEKLSSFEF